MSAYVPPTRIRIPTFNSPVKQAASQPSQAQPTAQPQTREEKRGARLNSRLGARGGGGGLASFHELMRASAAAAGGSQQQAPARQPTAGPSRTPAKKVATPKPVSAKAPTSPSAAGRRKSSAAPTRPSSARARKSAGTQPAPPLPIAVDVPVQAATGTKGKRQSSVKRTKIRSEKGKVAEVRAEEADAAEPEPDREIAPEPSPPHPTKRPRASTKTARPRPSTSSSSIAPTISAATAPTPASRLSAARKSVAATPAPPLPAANPTAPAPLSARAAVSRERTLPRAAMRAASKSKESGAQQEIQDGEDAEEEVVVVARDRVKKAKTSADSAPGRVAKKRKAQSDVATAAPKPNKKQRQQSPPPAPTPPPPKRRRPSTSPRSPITSVDDSDAKIASPEAATKLPETESVSESEMNEERGGGTASVRIKTERLQGNAGKLNAIDVVWERVRGVFRGALDGLKGPAASAVHQYADSVQLALLTRSDTTSALAHSASLAGAARASAKQLRAELLGVRQARAGVGARMRAEEEGWGQGRRRNELTRRLHRFVGELEVGALEWGAGQGGQAERPLRARLESVSRALGSGEGGTLANRVDRLNGELGRLQG